MMGIVERLLGRRHGVQEQPMAIDEVEELRGRRRVDVRMMASLEIPGERSLTCLVSDASRDGVRLTLPHSAVPRGTARLRLSFNGFEMVKPIRFVWSSGVHAGARFETSAPCPLMDSFERYIQWMRPAVGTAA